MSPAPPKDVWVFAYGSLMWRPGFPFVEAHSALLRGYHRSLCLYSTVYRGTKERPGLVFGLDRGGSSRGRAYRVAAADAAAVLRYLDDREITYEAYRRHLVPVALDDRRVEAFTYIINPNGPRYAGGLSHGRVIDLILQGHGIEGPCLEYVSNAVREMTKLGITGGRIHDLLAHIESTGKGAQAQRE